jgi:hypothetical protein
MSGGQDLRISLTLQDENGYPLDNANVHADLISPDGVVYKRLPCDNLGGGRYLAEIIQLPLHEAGGDWRVFAQASWEGDGLVETEHTFPVRPSISESYHEKYGFWLEPPTLFGFGTGFFSLHQGGGLHFEDWEFEDGGGFVILDNYKYESTGVTFLTLEVHWLPVYYPIDSSAAISLTHRVSETGFHHQDNKSGLMELTAEPIKFQESPTWRVTGQYREAYTAKSSSPIPFEITIFQCPGANLTWSLVITSDTQRHMGYLRSKGATFVCPDFDAH